MLTQKEQQELAELLKKKDAPHIFMSNLDLVAMEKRSLEFSNKPLADFLKIVEFTTSLGETLDPLVADNLRLIQEVQYQRARISQLEETLATFRVNKANKKSAPTS